jgi:hypothetical protein
VFKLGKTYKMLIFDKLISLIFWDEWSISKLILDKVDLINLDGENT